MVTYIHYLTHTSLDTTDNAKFTTIFFFFVVRAHIA